jgi:hypothetical protein
VDLCALCDLHIARRADCSPLAHAITVHTASPVRPAPAAPRTRRALWPPCTRRPRGTARGRARTSAARRARLLGRTRVWRRAVGHQRVRSRRLRCSGELTGRLRPTAAQARACATACTSPASSARSSRGSAWVIVEDAWAVWSINHYNEVCLCVEDDLRGVAAGLGGA